METHTRKLAVGQRIRVLIVDDSVVIRSLVRHALEEDPALEVIGTASNGIIALSRIPHLNPDVITLDIEMPEMDGLETLRRIRSERPHLRVIMLSALTERGAEVTLDALSRGADDYVAKTSESSSLGDSMTNLREELLPKIKQFFTMAPTSPAPVANGACLSPSLRARPTPRILLIGSSTGGPAALHKVLPQLAATFPLPVLIVQHMPPLFTKSLAERLNAACPLNVEEAGQGQPVRAGTVLVAPGNFHMKLKSQNGEVRVFLDQSPTENSCRPAVDALFSSAGDIYGGAVLAVILTGMGQDGLRGTHILRGLGATVFAQDEPSSVVWGMPGAVVNASLADQFVLPLDEVGAEIVRLAGGRQTAN